jgi:transglutaminase-like putative cysteine protease
VPELTVSPDYLAASRIIDCHHPAVVAKAAELVDGAIHDRERARRCFEFVRDDIRHSWDFGLNPVTCSASEVLRHGTGYCYAKSHLLAALLRASGIAAGLCYQRLSVDGGGAPFCLHGLNAVFLRDFGWYRIDARGNKPGVDAQFTPPVERLAFALDVPGEADLPGIHAEPLPLVVNVLTRCATVQQVYEQLPDLRPWRR